MGSFDIWRMGLGICTGCAIHWDSWEYFVFLICYLSFVWPSVCGREDSIDGLISWGFSLGFTLLLLGNTFFGFSMMYYEMGLDLRSFLKGNTI